MRHLWIVIFINIAESGAQVAHGNISHQQTTTVMNETTTEALTLKEQYNGSTTRGFQESINQGYQRLYQGHQGFQTPNGLRFQTTTNQGFKNPNNQGFQRPHHQGYQGPHHQGFQGPHHQGFQRPQDQGFQRPHHQGFQRPHHQGYRGPHHQGYQRPHHQGYQGPHHQGYQGPHHQGYQGPHHQGFQRPNHQGYQGPHHQGYQRPHHQGFQRPNNNDFQESLTTKMGNQKRMPQNSSSSPPNFMPVGHFFNYYDKNHRFLIDRRAPLQKVTFRHRFPPVHPHDVFAKGVVTTGLEPKTGSELQPSSEGAKDSCALQHDRTRLWQSITSQARLQQPRQFVIRTTEAATILQLDTQSASDSNTSLLTSPKEAVTSSNMTPVTSVRSSGWLTSRVPEEISTLTIIADVGSSSQQPTWPFSEEEADPEEQPKSRFNWTLENANRSSPLNESGILTQNKTIPTDKLSLTSLSDYVGPTYLIILTTCVISIAIGNLILCYVFLTRKQRAIEKQKRQLFDPSSSTEMY